MADDLLTRLEALAESAKTESERLIYRAQWACAMARLGHLGAARAEVTTLRNLNSTYSPQLTAWILLAEGQIEHYESLSVGAADKFKRAYGLAVAFGHSEIQCFAAAWIAASEFLMGDYEAASAHAAEAIQGGEQSGSLARTRAHLVLANCLNAVGARERAALHYGIARHFAVEARDISMQSAILYNVAAFHISWISLEDAFGEPTNKEIGTAELELNSISNLDSGIGVDSLTAMVPLLRAQLLVVKKDWAAANALYTSCVAEAASHGQLRLAGRYLAEQAHCLAMLKARDEAVRLVGDAMGQLTDRTDLDDRAACHARLALSLGALNLHTDSAAQMGAARIARSEFRAHQLKVGPRVASFADCVEAKKNPAEAGLRLP